MKICVFSVDGRRRFGYIDGDRVLDFGADIPDDCGDVTMLLGEHSAGLKRFRDRVGLAQTAYALKDVQLHQPSRRPQKYLAVGLNFRDHLREAKAAGMKIPNVPVIFNKQVSCLTGPYDPIVLPVVSEQLDYEGEMVMVIGTRCKNVTKEEAPRMIAGYMIGNDVSVRDWQFASPTATMGKSFDTHGPIGPWLTTADEVGDPLGLEIRTWVNGELRQSGNTRDMIWNCFELVEFISKVCTLEPGDLIATGTPSGIGFSRIPPQYLKEGDVVRIEIEKLGNIENKVMS